MPAVPLRSLTIPPGALTRRASALFGTSAGITGNNNTATGASALQNNTTGANNTANGVDALQANTTGADNTANGFEALLSNTTGGFNTANGVDALAGNSTGSKNTANGVSALTQNTIGHDNTAEGFNALGNNMAGSNNIAVGNNAGMNLTGGSNNIDIGANVLGNAGEANTIRIGKQGTQKGTFIAGISGTAVSGSPVVVASNGKLGVATSSAQFKEAIKPMDNASNAILCLKPVTFCYKEEVDPNKVPQFGLVAEEVEKIDPNLVVHDQEGKPFTVRHEAINAMLLNEFLKEHRTVAEQQSTIAELKTTVAQQQKQIESLAAGLQKVSAARSN